MTITITDEDIATLAQEIERGWPYTRVPRLFDLDYAIAVAEATSGREGELDVWHEVKAWEFDVMIGYWLLAREHHVKPYADEIQAKLRKAGFGPGEALQGMATDELDGEDFEGALGVLEVVRYLQADR